MTVSVSTRAGKRHEKSEDAVLVGETVLTEASGTFSVPERGFVCVADGVGGSAGGAQASRFVLEALAGCDCADSASLKSLLSETNRALIRRAAGSFAPEMATTLTGLMFSPDTAVLFHAGNTRAYIKQGGFLKQITSDHTTYSALLSRGQYEAAELCNKSEITTCFGGGSETLLSKLYITNCQRFTLALLTSDGVHDHLDIDTLEAVINGEGTYEDKCRKITDLAAEAGSEDDLSAVIIRL